jgi:hypothetical protein
MKISVASLHDLDENERLHDRVARRLDQHLAVVCLVEHSQSVSEVLLDLSFGSDANLVLDGLRLILDYFLIALHKVFNI